MKIFKFLKYIDTRKIYIYIILSILVSFAELITIASIIPFVLIVFESEEKNTFSEYLDFIPINFSDNLTNVIILYSSILIISYLVKIYSLIYTAKISHEIGHEVRLKIFSYSIFQNYQKILDFNQNKILSLVSLKIHDFVSYVSNLIQLISSLFTSFIIILFLFYLDYQITILAILIFGIYFILIFYKNKNLLYENGKIISKSHNKIIETFKTAFGFIEEITIYDLKKKINSTFEEISKIMSTKYQNTFIIGSLPRIQIEYISIILIFVLVLVIKSKDFAMSLNIALLASFGIGAQKLLPLTNKIFNNLSSLRAATPAYIEFIKFLEKFKNFKIDYKINKNIEFNNFFEIKNYNFKYKNSTNKIFNNLNIKVKKGSTVNIYGESGSGKSTLSKIILGLLSGNSGKLIVDGNIIIDNRYIANWQSKISYVSQDPYIFDGTLIENITLKFNNEKVDKNLLDMSCKMALLNNFVNKLDNKINTFVQNNGSILSGGQKQRIAIARAIYKNSEIIVLDEPTSALDNRIGNKIVMNLKRMNNTLIFMSHSNFIKKINDKNIRLKLNNEIFK